jgi:DUF1365 family protein
VVTSVPALYAGTVSHARQAPVRNRFRYGAYLWLIDLDRPPRLPRGLGWLGRFDPADHVDVRAFLAEHGRRAERILMLANARALGYVFNPISVFWCYDTTGVLVATVAEVHNTYGGRHAYLVDAGPDGAADVPKALYVSPFYPVDGRYVIRAPEPDDRLALSVTLHRDGDQPFVATMRGERRPLTLANLARAWLRYPWEPLRVTVLIRRQGIRLWRRGLEVQPR